MALQKARFSDLPQDAIVLNERQALTYHMSVINNWENKSETFIIKYGPYILGGASFFTGVYINNLYRLKFHLHNLGRMSTYLPTCCIPAIFSAAFHVQQVLTDVVLMKTECPVCVEMRASAIQATLGFIFPMIMSPISCLALAHRYATYDVPYITSKPMEVIKLLKKMMFPTRNLLFAIFVGHALLGSAVTFFEAKSVFAINSQLAKLEYDAEHGL